MGFMMLQCGLGAFSVALLHIVAHSAYKAHAFLSSGSVLDAAARVRTPLRPVSPGSAALIRLPIALATASGLLAMTVWLLGVDYTKKPGAVVLGLILVLALTQLVWQSLLSGSWRVVARAVAGAAVVSLGYFLAYLVVDRVLSGSVSYLTISPSPLDALVISLVAAAFLGVFVLQASAGPLSGSPRIQALYVHAANAFYLDIPARRLTARVWGRSNPTP